MKTRLTGLLILFTTMMFVADFASAEDKIKFAFADAELRLIIETYAKASGKKILVDPGVRGKATIYAPDDVSLEEALNLMASALEVNGFSFIERDDLLYICSSRNIQRNLIPLFREEPPLKPTRMATMILDLKHASAENLNKYLRILPSKDGEMTPYEPTNQLIVSDYTPNLIRIYKMIQELDKPETKEFRAKQDDWKKKNNGDKKIGGLSPRKPPQRCGDLDCLFEDQ